MKALFANRRRFVMVLLAVSIVASIILAIVFRDQIRAGVVVPVSYVIWYINLILETVPQPIFWIVLILGGFIIAGRTILRNLPSSELPSEPVYHGQSASRYQYWMWYMSTYQISYFSSENLARNLARFILNILAHQEHMTPSEVEQCILDRKVDLPEDIRTFLIERRLMEKPPNNRMVLRWFERLLNRSQPGNGRPSDAPEARQKMLRIIAFIEERLELSYLELPHGKNP